MLGTIVDPAKLKEERQRCLEKASWCEKQRKATILDYSGKTFRRNAFTFTKDKSTFGNITVEPKKETTSKKRTFSEMVKDKVSAVRVQSEAKAHGYDLRPRTATPVSVSKILGKKKHGKRSKRGALIPKVRPDLEARRAQSDSEKILSRGRKRRKNKKKQKRDEALTAFVFNNI